MARKSKRALANERSALSAIVILCGWCGLKVETKKYRFSSWERSCEVCGSHGEVKLVATCLLCEKEVEISLESW